MITQDPTASLSKSLIAAADSISERSTTLEQLLELLGEQGFLFICIILTLPFLFPVSIPGVSTIFGLTIFFISIGITLNRVPWLPQRVLNSTFDTSKVIPQLKKGAVWVSKIEHVIKPRFLALTNYRMSRFNGFCLVASAVLLMFPLGLVPFSNTLPAVAIMFLCLGSLQRDGVCICVGYAVIVATIVYFALLAFSAFAGGQWLVERVV